MAYSMRSRSQCDSKQTTFLVAFSHTKRYSVHMWKRVSDRVCMCGFGPADVKLTQGLTLSSARGPSVPPWCWNAFWDTRQEIRAQGPAISQTYCLAPLRHAVLRRHL